MSEMLVIVSKIKKMVKEKGFRTGGDFIEALSKKVEGMITESINKVKDEGKKKTLGGEDLS